MRCCSCLLSSSCGPQRQCPLQGAPLRGPSHPQIPLQLGPALPALRLGIEEAARERMSRSSGGRTPGSGEQRDRTPEGPPGGTQDAVCPVSPQSLSKDLKWVSYQFLHVTLTCFQQDTAGRDLALDRFPGKEAGSAGQWLAGMGGPREEGDTSRSWRQAGRGRTGGLLQGAHLSSPPVEVGPAERLGPESGGLPLPQLGRKHVVGCGPCAWGRQVPTRRAPEGVVGSRPTSTSSQGPPAQVGCPDGSAVHPVLTGVLQTEWVLCRATVHPGDRLLRLLPQPSLTNQKGSLAPTGPRSPPSTLAAGSASAKTFPRRNAVSWPRQPSRVGELVELPPASPSS